MSDQAYPKVILESLEAAQETGENEISEPEGMNQQWSGYVGKCRSMSYASMLIGVLVLAGHLYEGRDICGKYRMHGCKADGIFRRIMFRCNQRDCNECFEQWIVKSATRIGFNLVSTLAVMGAGIRFEHVVVSVPPDLYYMMETKEGRKELRERARGWLELVMRDYLGGVMFDHAYRFTPKLLELKNSPHFHFLVSGFIIPEAVKAVWDEQVMLSKEGPACTNKLKWLAPTKNIRYENLTEEGKHLRDKNWMNGKRSTNWLMEKPGFVVRGLSVVGTRDDLFRVARYLLSHTSYAVKEGNARAEQSVRYLGKFGNNQAKRAAVKAYDTNVMVDVAKNVFPKIDELKGTENECVEDDLVSVEIEEVRVDQQLDKIWRGSPKRIKVSHYLDKEEFKNAVLMAVQSKVEQWRMREPLIKHNPAFAKSKSVDIDGMPPDREVFGVVDDGQSNDQITTVIIYKRYTKKSTVCVVLFDPSKEGLCSKCRCKYEPLKYMGSPGPPDEASEVRHQEFIKDMPDGEISFDPKKHDFKREPWKDMDNYMTMTEYLITLTVYDEDGNVIGHKPLYLEYHGVSGELKLDYGDYHHPPVQFNPRLHGIGARKVFDSQVKALERRLNKNLDKSAIWDAVEKCRSGDSTIDGGARDDQDLRHIEGANDDFKKILQKYQVRMMGQPADAWDVPLDAYKPKFDNKVAEPPQNKEAAGDVKEPTHYAYDWDE